MTTTREAVSNRARTPTKLNLDFNSAPASGEASLPGVLPAGFTLRDDLRAGRMAKRLDLVRALGRSGIGEDTALVRDWTRHQTQAFDVLNATSTWKSFVTDNETPSLRARYGNDRLGRSCLVARRLVEAGVSLVTVIFGGWDTHSHHLEHTRDRLLPPLNRAFAALLDDLADRGLLDTTLVAWTGEFGRRNHRSASAAGAAVLRAGAATGAGANEAMKSSGVCPSVRRPACRFCRRPALLALRHRPIPCCTRWPSGRGRKDCCRCPRAASKAVGIFDDGVGQRAARSGGQAVSAGIAESRFRAATGGRHFLRDHGRLPPHAVLETPQKIRNNAASTLDHRGTIRILRADNGEAMIAVEEATPGERLKARMIYDETIEIEVVQK